jgi:hypothetical protein
MLRIQLSVPSRFFSVASVLKLWRLPLPQRYYSSKLPVTP